MQLQQGEKRGLGDLGIEARFRVAVEYGLSDMDMAAFGLDQNGKIGDDRYVVLFSNLKSPDGEIELASGPGNATFSVDLDRLPEKVHRIVFTATHDVRAVAESRPLAVTLGDGKAQFDVASCLNDEKAVMMIEIYRHSAGWKVGAVAAGFAGGLAALIEHFGGEVGGHSSAIEAAASPPVNLTKIKLEKSNPTVNLKKTGANFGEITVNLNWNQGSARRGIFGGPRPVDLDLGVLFELEDGYRGVVQALGNAFGAFHVEPWIELSGDDRTGAVSSGETIRVNGAYFSHIRRLAFFALIYDGVPNWQQTDGVVRVTIPGQPEIEVRMDDGRNDRRLCGIALIDNVSGDLRVTRHMQYYESQKPFADDIGIYLQWTAGSKD
ncbi:tellurium resistance protein TerA [Novosphingobium indicum]|uniref:Tellurium resistance protein TerA n=1 Tax=Novosphingobium indicum TaxID=462949 RepID=A0ABQ2K0M4_9SPHN|nr:tellurium resistance protein TerA [Novosphingobium indicum]